MGFSRHIANADAINFPLNFFLESIDFPKDNAVKNRIKEDALFPFLLMQTINPFNIDSRSLIKHQNLILDKYKI